MDPMPKHEEVSFMQPIQTIVPASTPVDALQLLCDSLRRQHPTSSDARKIASDILKHTDSLQKLDQLQWHTQVCDLMSWNKSEFKDILKG